MVIVICLVTDYVVIASKVFTACDFTSFRKNVNFCFAHYPFLVEHNKMSKY